MKTSINAWTFPNEYSFYDCIRAAKEAGFEAIEFNLDREGRSEHSFTLASSEKDILEVRRMMDEYGIEAASVSSSLHSGLWAKSITEARALARTVLEKQLTVASILGAGAILLVPGGMSDGMTLSESRKSSIENLRTAEPIIRKYSGIKVGLENVWNGFFLSPYDMVSFLDELDPELFGAYYDLGNMVAFSDTHNWTDVVAPRTVRIHVKDFKRNGGINRGGRFCQLLEGDVDFKRAMQQLKAAGFDAYLTAEVFKDDPEMSDKDYLRSIVEAEEIIRKYYEEA